MKFYELILGFVLYTLLSGYCFAYCLEAAFAKNVPWYADIAAGFVGGTLFIPLAIVAWVCQLCDITTPFFV